MKKIFLLLVLSILSITIVNAQEAKKIWFGINVSAGLSLTKQVNVYETVFPESKSFSSIHAILGYYVRKDLSLGIGIGLNSYSNPGLNTVPLLLDIKYHPFMNDAIFLNGNVGVPLAVNEDYISSKFNGELSIGYMLLKNKKINIAPSLGYSLCQYNITDYKQIVHNNKRHSVFLKLSVIF